MVDAKDWDHANRRLRSVLVLIVVIVVVVVVVIVVVVLVLVVDVVVVDFLHTFAYILSFENYITEQNVVPIFGERYIQYTKAKK